MQKAGGEEKSGQAVAGVQFDLGNIGRVDRAGDIDVIAEVRRADCYARLQLGLRNVGGIHGFVSGRVAEQNIHAHRGRRKHLRGNISHVV